MKKIILSPLFGSIVASVFLVFFALFAIYQYVNGDVFFFDDWHQCDITAYTIYGIAAVVGLFCFRDFKGTKQKTSYFLFYFLMIVAVLREMGLQHWLTKTDSTAIKIRFFTNPNNPLFEKVRAAVLLLIVVAVVFYLLWIYVPKIWRGFWNKEPLYWTICTFAAMGIICKIADRFPSNYYKSEGVHLSPDVTFIFTLVEESTEATLPLLFAVAMIQYHLMHKK